MSTRATGTIGTGPEVLDASFVRGSVEIAESAIADLWDTARGTFWRSTQHRAREQRKGSKADIKEFFPTVTFRCLEALLACRRHTPDWMTKGCTTFLNEVCSPSVSRRPIADLMRSSLPPSQQFPNLFTQTLYLSSFARLLQSDVPLGNRDEVQNSLKAGLDVFVSRPEFRDDRIVRLHPFLNYHAKRVVSACVSIPASFAMPDGALGLCDRLDNASRASINESLALRRTGSLTPSRAISVAFSAAGLGLRVRTPLPMPGESSGSGERYLTREDQQRIMAALEISLEQQDGLGYWPLARVQAEDKDIAEGGQIEISPFEVMGAIASAGVGLLLEERWDDESQAYALLGSLAAKLVNSARYAERSTTHLSDAQRPNLGWSSDVAFGASIIESWTTAAVLEGLVYFSDFVLEYNRRLILSTFTTLRPSDRDWPTWLCWKDFVHDAEMDSEVRPLDYLETNFLRPILNAPGGVPPVSPRSVGLLLFGPPGTAKTSTAKALAEGLGWPVVVLTPGNFIERGLEYIESQAKSVFERLMQLSRAFVLFDECDELFRMRKPTDETEQSRGITAFVTASMLPKLQDLHDRGRVVFCICTNHLGSMDPAVKRGGRIDHVIGVGPPDQAARKRIASQLLSRLFPTFSKGAEPRFSAAIDRLVESSNTFTRPEVERATSNLAHEWQRKQWATDEEGKAIADAVIGKSAFGLTITGPEYETFLRDRKMYDHAFARSKNVDQ